MKPIRVLGIGSPFGDDKLGWEVIRLLQQKKTLQAQCARHLDLLACDRPGIRLLELMKGATIVYIVDAIQTGAKPGTIHRFQENELSQFSQGLSSHALGISESIEIGRSLNILPGTIIFYGIEMEPDRSLDFLSQQVQDATIQVAISLTTEIMTLV